MHFKSCNLTIFNCDHAMRPGTIFIVIAALVLVAVQVVLL